MLVYYKVIIIDMELKLVLQYMRENKYNIRVKKLSPAMKYLIECNVLFFDGNSVRPQKKLMIEIIEVFLQEPQ